MTIKNMVFDIGNVLLHWEPAEIYKNLFNKEDFDQHPLSTIVGGEIWLDMDQGLLNFEEGIIKAIRGNETFKEEIETFFRKAPYHFYPIQKTVDYALKCKANGYRLFLLSNFHEYGYGILRKRYNFFDNFEGGVISWKVKLNKPDPEIYKILLSKYELDPEETFFIDDTLENIEAAENLGIRGIHFKRGMDLSLELESVISNRI